MVRTITLMIGPTPSRNIRTRTIMIAAIRIVKLKVAHATARKVG
jgi:hypothetical protein